MFQLYTELCAFVYQVASLNQFHYAANGWNVMESFILFHEINSFAVCVQCQINTLTLKHSIPKTNLISKKEALLS